MAKMTISSYNVLLKEMTKLDDMIAETARNLNEALAEGDLSENAGYEKAKDDLKMFKSRRYELEDLLSSAEIIKPNTGNEIDLGSYIRVSEYDGSTRLPGKLFVLDSIERILAGFIGIQSPLGKKIRGGLSGDYIVHSAGRGIKFYVEKVQPTPEIEEEFIRNSKTLDEIFDEC